MFKIKILILSLLALLLRDAHRWLQITQRPKVPVPQHFSVNDTKDNKQPPTARIAKIQVGEHFSLTLS